MYILLYFVPSLPFVHHFSQYIISPISMNIEDTIVPDEHSDVARVGEFVNSFVYAFEIGLG